MDSTLKAKWLEALRSGKYKQGNGYLRKGDEYCCLGVLAEVAGADCRKRSIIEDLYTYNFLSLGGNDGAVALLDPDYQEKIGLSVDASGRAICMNDKGESFDKIADYLEEHA